MAETFTLDWTTLTITVVFTDGSQKVYADAASYLADFPDRAGDAAAMGWQ